MRWRATSADGHTGSGVYTFGIGVTPPPPTEAFGSTGPGWADDAARWAFFVSLALLLGTIGFRLLILREPLQARLSNRLYGIATAGGIAVLNVGIAAFVMRAVRRAAGAVRRPALRRSLAARDEDALRGRVRRDDPGLRDRHGPRPARVDPRPAAAPLAGVPDRARLRLRAVAVGTSGRRAELDVPDRARRLAAPRRRDPLGRRPRRPGGVRLAARPDAAAERVPRLLPDRDGPRRGARARRHLSLDLPPADASPISGRRTTATPCSSRSRSSASRSAGERCTTSSCGHGSSAARRRGRCGGA